MALDIYILLLSLPIIFNTNALEGWSPGSLEHEWNWGFAGYELDDAFYVDALGEILHHPQDNFPLSSKTNIQEMHRDGFHASSSSQSDSSDSMGDVIDARAASPRDHWQTRILDDNRHTARKTGQGDGSTFEQSSETSHSLGDTASTPSDIFARRSKRKSREPGEPTRLVSPSIRFRMPNRKETAMDMPTPESPPEDSKPPKANKRFYRSGRGSFKESASNTAGLETVFARIQDGSLTGSLLSLYPETTRNTHRSNNVPRLTFDMGLFDHVQDLEGHTHNLAKLVQMIEELPGGQMVIPPKKFKKFMNVFSPTKQNTSSPPIKFAKEVTEKKFKNIRDAERYEFMKERKREFNESQNIWLIYWMTQTKKNFNTHLQTIKGATYIQVFPFFLFYVEMINTTVLRQQETTHLGYTEELETACESFLDSIIQLKKIQFAPLTSPTMMEDNLFQQTHALAEREGQQRVLWIFLELWMKTHHPDFWKRNLDRRKIGLNRNIKVFFNNIFCYTIRNLNDRYKMLGTLLDIKNVI
ncbi:hypothetical protein MJO28_004565 [Puccinia striiformis f. sp. tritici]|uniref:Uncharacterized protein n=2 Tax=Puccinia striiformis f. sp. tritici TaxID=168172 RepID=A0A0L0VAY8_9BASI|nr:hypothetical protein Pst134EB_007991 [Puccinia striiformis f. sp. tritici]KAI7957470.1 hypothetical protein MJO28_004565 [Puccinia striiformis f. sp. tritici]KAI7963298.1 hypothetical protein MJO29_003725 [Puccinia striiformis f. sp. tritici]KNE96371.1 hypothetical protein PSTG_10337 [Puccinia striiformis f. sp. tritici PST-78]